MNNTKTRRIDWRKEATRRTLIETAERLFGTQGIDSTSLRQIGEAIGSSNANVVGYHFGTKEDLIMAIIRYREPWLNQRRGQFYKELSQNPSHSKLEHLLYSLWYPLFEQVDEDGMHSFAGFLAELIRTDRGKLRRLINTEYPETDRISSEIFECFSGEDKTLVEQRMGVVLGIITSQLRMIDLRKKKLDISHEGAESLFRDALRMVKCALEAPTY